jgi:hypothetical protein
MEPATLVQTHFVIPAPFIDPKEAAQNLRQEYLGNDFS